MREAAAFRQMEAGNDFSEGGWMKMNAKELSDHGQWAIALVVAGMAIAVPATVAGNKDAFLIALGMILYGAGQMRNRQIQQAVQFDTNGRMIGEISGYPHRFTIVGTTLSLCGAALFGFGLYRFILW